MDLKTWRGKFLSITALAVCALSQTSFTKTGAWREQAEPASIIWGYLSIGILGLWIISAVAGWIMLLRRGYFADQLDKVAAGREWLGCVIGVFLLAGLWMVAVLPGPFLIWFAKTRKPRPQCPNCKNWLPYGATHCVHCDMDIVTGEKGAPPAENIIRAQEFMPVSDTTCEKCGVENTAGQKYFFFYGTFTGSEYQGGNRTRYDFKIAGSQEVYLCDRCVSKFGQIRTRRRSLWMVSGIALIGIIIPLLQLLMPPAGSDGTVTSEYPFFVTGFMLLLAAGMYFILQRQHSKAPLAQGDGLAIELRAPVLRQQGYTRFYTREQMKSNQLM